MLARTSPPSNEPRTRHLFVVPDLQGPRTGGTIFNAELLAALAARRMDARRIEESRVRDALMDERPSHIWVDSLHLDAVARLRAEVVARHRIGLITHYLPSLVARGASLGRDGLGAEERLALDAADVFLATSEFMASVLEKLADPARPVLVVEPGRFATGVAPAAPPSATVRAAIVANLVPGKGVDRFLRELADRVGENDGFTLTIVGSHTLDGDCAAACERLVQRHPILTRAVRFAGSLAPLDVVTTIAANDLVISASTMESYGMALAEARTLGVPILAVAGGNVERLVGADAGAELVDDPGHLAASFLRLCREPLLLSERSAAARGHALGPRSWTQAADDFEAQLRTRRALRLAVPPLAADRNRHGER